MTSFSIFQQTLPAGTGTGGDASNQVDLGVQWEITSTGYVLDGYWFYVPTGGDTNGAHYSFRLYSTTNGTSGTLISGSTVSGSGTWTAGAWNFAPLTPSVALVNGTVYVAAVTVPIGAVSYQSLGHYWDTGAGSGGNTVHGPVTAFDAVNAFGNLQQVFNEPSTGGMPVTQFHNSFYGIDIDVVAASTNVTGTVSVALAPMKLAATAAETVSGQASVALAPMKLAATAHETGVNVTGTVSMAMAPMKLAASGPQGADLTVFLGPGGVW